MIVEKGVVREGHQGCPEGTEVVGRDRERE